MIMSEHKITQLPWETCPRPKQNILTQKMGDGPLILASRLDAFSAYHGGNGRRKREVGGAQKLMGDPYSPGEKFEAHKPNRWD